MTFGKVKTLKFTRKTRFLLWIAEKLRTVECWLKRHCDMELVEPFKLTKALIEDSQFKIVQLEEET